MTDTERISALEATAQRLFDLIAAEQEQRKQMDSETAPVGAVVAFAAEGAPPGWLLCDGTAVSREKFATLFAVIKTRHGAGDGSTTFNLPDYSGRFLRGANTSHARRDSGPRTAMASGGVADGVGSIEDWTTGAPRLVSFVTANDGVHHHSYDHQDGLFPLYNGYDINNAGSHHPIARLNLQSFVTADAGGHHHAVTGGDTETRPDNAAVSFIIKY